MLFGADAILLAVIVMSALLVWRHSGNIGNLIAGKESKLGSKSGASKKAK
jgi:glycerol-3-phosphate acyltransferase PlsY